MKSIRLYAAGPLAAVCTTGLFLVMQGLVGNDGEVILDTIEPTRFIDVIQVDPPAIPVRKKWILDPPEIIEIKDIEIIEATDKGGPPKLGIIIRPPKPPVDAGIQLTNFGQSDGDYLPIVRVQPQYPRRAQEHGIEGYAVVELTVSRDGSVPPHSIVIVDAEPRGVFDKAAKKAAEKFKYKPRVIDGVAQAVTGVRYRFSFTMAE